MKILIISQHFWPEEFLINSLVVNLQSKNVEVTVLTGFPNYPHGDFFKNYRGYKCKKEYFHDNIEVFRVPIFPRKSGRAWQLILNYISFIISASFCGPILLRKKKFDLIFIFGTSPVFQAIPGIFLKTVKKIPLIIWLQDLWPDVLKATGFVNNSKLLALRGYFVGWIYRRSDLILVQSKAFVNDVIDKCPTAKLEYHPNTSIEMKHGSVDSLKLNISDKFSLMFAGNFGKAQSLDTILDAAEVLKNDQDIVFVLVGTGNELIRLKQKIEEKDLNIILPGQFSHEEMPGILQQASALIISLSNDPIVSKTVPSKLQTYMAIGKPIIAAIKGEGARLIIEAKAGYVSNPDDPIQLSRNILRLRSLNEKELKALGQNASKFYYVKFESNLLLEKLLEYFEVTIRDYHDKKS